jgi:charged multivesicular body protein 6
MGATSSKITQQDKAILQVKLQRDKLNKYQRTLHYQLAQQRKQIQTYLAQRDKQSAKLLLKRLKYQEKLNENIADQIMNLENMIRTIEFKIIEKEFLSGLSKGNELLKKLNNELNVDSIEKLVDDVRNNIAYQEEVDAVLSGSVIGRDYNDEIDDELAELEKEVNNNGGGKVPEMPTVVGLPEIKEQEQQQQGKQPQVAESNNKKKVAEGKQSSRTVLLA